MFKETVVAAALMLLSSAAFSEEISGTNYSYGNWIGAAYTFTGTNDFSHCVVSAPFLSGDTLFLTVNRNATVSIGVQSPALDLVAGQTFPVTLVVDRRAPIYATATAVDSKSAMLNIVQFEMAMDALQRGRTLFINSAVGNAQYDLTGTYRALEYTLQCAMANSRYHPPVTAADSSVENGTDKTMLFQVATQMISELQVSDFRYLTPQEVTARFQSDGVFWTSDASGITGGVAMLPLGSNKSLSDTDGDDVDFLAKGCKGEVATTFKPIAMPDMLAREIRALCIDGEMHSESLLTKVLIGDQVLYMLLMFSGDESVVAPVSRQERSEQAVVRAANYVKGELAGN